MKKLFIMLGMCLLLTGCGKDVNSSTTAPSGKSEFKKLDTIPETKSSESKKETVEVTVEPEETLYSLYINDDYCKDVNLESLLKQVKLKAGNTVTYTPGARVIFKMDGRVKTYNASRENYVDMVTEFLTTDVSDDKVVEPIPVPTVDAYLEREAVYLKGFIETGYEVLAYRIAKDSPEVVTGVAITKDGITYSYGDTVNWIAWVEEPTVESVAESDELFKEGLVEWLPYEN